MAITVASLESRATCSIEEAAELLGISRKLAYESAARGQIPTLALGRRKLVPVPALLAMLDGDPK